jgi:HSP20 family molecular chaperone IbpA
VKLDDVKATFADGVLEVTVPMPPPTVETTRSVEIGEPSTAANPAA